MILLLFTPAVAWDMVKDCLLVRNAHTLQVDKGNNLAIVIMLHLATQLIYFVPSFNHTTFKLDSSKTTQFPCVVLPTLSQIGQTVRCFPATTNPIKV